MHNLLWIGLFRFVHGAGLWSWLALFCQDNTTFLYVVLILFLLIFPHATPALRLDLGQLINAHKGDIMTCFTGYN